MQRAHKRKKGRDFGLGKTFHTLKKNIPLPILDPPKNTISQNKTFKEFQNSNHHFTKATSTHI